MDRHDILIVDDERFFINTIIELLRDNYEVRVALNGEEAIERATQNPPDLILLDVIMPDLSGYEVCERLKANPATRHVPIIFLTIKSDIEDEVHGFDIGAVDFISKPISPPILRARIRTHLSLRDARVELEKTNQSLEARVIERTKALNDEIAERKSLETRLSYVANYDPLTKLPNRVLFIDHLSLALKSAERNSTITALVLIDLDGFKFINDTLGHHRGDTLLCKVADQIRQCTRDIDMLSRLGGDEFGLILNDLPDREAAAITARKILQRLAIPIDLERIDHISACVGIAFYPDDAKSSEKLLRDADIAMYEAKRKGKNSFEFFTPSLNHELVTRIETEKELKRALKEHQFTLYYQPIFETESNKLYGAEALIRWVHPVKGLIPPDHFIPIAEECGLIVEIGQWVLEEALRQAVIWNRQEGIEDLHISVNMSTRQFNYSDSCIDTLEDSLRSAGLDSRLLNIEITESLMMENSAITIDKLLTLKRIGVGLSIDDFGTGYSSLSYIRSFPINTIKIDRSFVHDITIDSDDAALISAIIAMAESLGLNVIAEGVENEQQLNFLCSKKCRYVQGYYFSRPVPPEEFEQQILLNQYKTPCADSKAS